MEDQPLKPLTDKQRARITENFRAAKALLARKRLPRHLATPNIDACKHAKNANENAMDFASPPKIRYMTSVKVTGFPEMEQSFRSPISEKANIMSSRNFQRCTRTNFQDTKIGSDDEHNKDLDERSNATKKLCTYSDSRLHRMNDRLLSTSSAYSICNSESAKGNQNSGGISRHDKSMLIDVLEEEFDDAFFEKVDALCKKKSDLHEDANPLKPVYSSSILENASNASTTINIEKEPNTSMLPNIENASNACFHAPSLGPYKEKGKDHLSSSGVNSSGGVKPSCSTSQLCVSSVKKEPQSKPKMEFKPLASQNLIPKWQINESQVELLEALVTSEISTAENPVRKDQSEVYEDPMTGLHEGGFLNSASGALPEYLRLLNETQREAATSDIFKPLLILAGPGSGKTSTMVARLLTILNKGVHPKNVLAMTFTTAAATEMRERVAVIVGKTVAKEISVCTFHSFCLHLCRSHAEKLGRTSEFLIYGHSQQRKGVIEAIRLSTMEGQLNEFEHTSNEAFCIDGKRTVVSIKEKAKKWQKFVTQAKSAGRTPEDYDRMGIKDGATILRHYNAILKTCNALDYHDFINCAVILLRDYQEVFVECQNTWTTILVDEFQDTSIMQYSFLKLLASHNHITVVGDDDQSIFSFNGADVSGFDSFRKDFPDHKEIRLHQNYRSTRCIVEAASSLIQNNVSRCSGKRVFTDNIPGDKIVIKECRNEDAQCAYVVDNILMSKQENHTSEPSFANIAILYRRQVTGKLFQSTLRLRKIPFNVHGVAFYRKKIIKVVIAMLQTTLPRCADAPYRCVFKALYSSEKDERRKAVDYIERIASHTKSTFMMVAREIFNAKVSGTFNRQQLAQGRRVLSVLDMIYRLVRKEQSLSAVVTSLINFIPQKYLFEKRAILDEDNGKLLNEDKDSRSVLDYLLDDVSDFLVNISSPRDTMECSAEKTDNEGCLSVLKVFLDYLCAREMENFKERKEHNHNSVTLTTMHQSKGLEWDTVFIVKTNDTEIPLLHESNGNVKNGATSLEEERRLFYVAMTRARKKLYILYVLMDSNRQLLQPSRFLRELPTNLIDLKVDTLSSKKMLEPSHAVDEQLELCTKAQTIGSDSLHNEGQSPLDMPNENDSDHVSMKGIVNIRSSFLQGFNIEARSMIASLFHTWAKKRAFQDPKRLLDKVGFVIDERIRSKTTKNKDVLRALKCCLKDDEAISFAEHVIKWEMLPADEKSLLQAERQEHFQKKAAERAMDSAAATSKQIAYLQQLGCTTNPTSRLHASRLIEQYKNL